MDADRFDDVLRQWERSRRPVLGAGLGALLGAAGLAGTEARKKKKKKKCKPNCAGKTCGDNGCGGSCGTCRSCEACQNGTCFVEPDNAVCGGTGRCLNGACRARPTCIGTATLSNPGLCGHDPTNCCAGPDRCVYGGSSTVCWYQSTVGEPCFVDGDCSASTCVGYRCQAA